jgi:peptidoglycan/xylan/chitin deacetylase (PgdA/CDA1 family)
MGSPTFIISLDFELFWGVRDVTTLDRYGPNLRGVREAIPAMLRLFSERGIRATWATVGFLFFASKTELCAGLPRVRPAYGQTELCPYRALDAVGQDEAEDPYHFGRSLVDRIRACPGQEIGTHTFSHYYALEPGQDRAAYEADMRAAIRVARSVGVELRSLVFPRNQVNADYLGTLRELGITSYRGTEASWLYQGGTQDREHLARRGGRLLDAYLPISGHHTFRLDDAKRRGPPFDLPASRFLRPWSPRLDRLEELRLRRIERGMTYAARRGEVFHLWWHPHNFGVNQARNLANLTRLLNHFETLRNAWGMESASMGDVAARLLERAPRSAVA